MGNEKRIPARGEKAAISPMIESSAPSDCAKRGNTGFFEMVVEKMAKNPRRKR